MYGLWWGGSGTAFFRKTAVTVHGLGLFCGSGQVSDIPDPPPDSPGTSRAHLPPGRCGRGPRPTSETPPSELRAWEGTDTGQLWGVAHRTTPWASGHTTTDPQETPGQHLPGGPTARHSGDILSTGRKHASEYTGEGNRQSPTVPPLPALCGGYAVNMRHRGECESQSTCMAWRCSSQSACMAPADGKNPKFLHNLQTMTSQEATSISAQSCVMFCKFDPSNTKSEPLYPGKILCFLEQILCSV